MFGRSALLLLLLAVPAFSFLDFLFGRPKVTKVSVSEVKTSVQSTSTNLHAQNNHIVLGGPPSESAIAVKTDPAQIKRTAAIAKEVNDIIARSFTDEGTNKVNCLHDDAKVRTDLPAGAVRCTLLFKPKNRDSFDSSSSTGRLLKAIDHLNIIAQYSSDTTCHAGKSSKNGEVVESNGVECNVYVYPMQK